jgi:hypothetical protein
MALDAEQGKRMLQLLTSRYDDRHWRKKIEKTLSLPGTGVSDEAQREIFLYLKHGLKAYKSRRADPDSWIVGGFATREVIERARFNPAVVGSSAKKEHVTSLGVDPGSEVDEAWWEEMLVAWFEQPDVEPSAEEASGSGNEPAGATADAKIKKADA